MRGVGRRCDIPELGRAPLIAEAALPRRTVRPPEAVEAMREIGIDISGHRAKSAEEFVGQDFNHIVTVCDNAKETCPVLPGHAERLHHRACQDYDAGKELVQERNYKIEINCVN
jgi:protein-tyrosine-phosphatase